MKILNQCFTFLVLLCLTVSTVTSRTVTDGEKDKIFKGINAAKTFSGVLQGKDFTKVLKSMTETITPWVDAIGIFSDVIGLFLPEENEMLNEMKKGFEEVNKRLDDIKDELTEVKEAIDWAVVKVNFMSLEQKIRLMDEKLKEVVQSPNPTHGKVEYIRVYEDQYDEAGLMLWDSIVHNDQVFYQNIVTAGMKYTDYRRDKMNNFMRGLIALVMKSSNVEVSYEKFKEHDRGMVAVWKNRLVKTKDALAKADEVLLNAWQDLFRNEVDKIAKDCNGWDHVPFRDQVYNFLKDKYPWRVWYVLSYEAVLGSDNHAVHYLNKYNHCRFRFYGRNFLVGSSEPDWPFDAAAASRAIKDIQCPDSQSYCSKNSAYRIVELCEEHGIARAAIRATKDWAVIGGKQKSVWALMNIRKGSWFRAHFMFYFG